MKKGKIMLIAITVFGVVGGALAFKTSKLNHQMCIATIANWCKLVPGRTTLNAIATFYYTTTLNCPPNTFTACTKKTVVTTVNDLP